MVSAAPERARTAANTDAAAGNPICPLSGAVIPKTADEKQTNASGHLKSIGKEHLLTPQATLPLERLAGSVTANQPVRRSWTSSSLLMLLPTIDHAACAQGKPFCCCRGDARLPEAVGGRCREAKGPTWRSGERQPRRTRVRPLVEFDRLRRHRVTLELLASSEK
jgi:hypothetical protein